MRVILYTLSEKSMKNNNTRITKMEAIQFFEV
ncbi:hypothetical protein ABIB30_003659 [Pedobacter sp. UYP1]